MRIGVEVGGTFTDLVLEREGRLDVVKVPSTPGEPDRGVMDAITRSAADLGEVTELVHGSTIATNAILERKGARVGLVVTRGTRDILFLQRHDRRRIYDLHYRKPQPVVRRADVVEVDERLDAAGQAVRSLDRAATRDVLATFLAERELGAVAVCLLNSFVDPAHELAVAALIEELAPGLPVACSHQVNREFREYERCSTTTLSAYVMPVVAAYLARMERELGERGFRGTFSVMQSNGGRLPAAAMAGNAITALLSGPAAGVVGAVAAAAASGEGNLITLDMGGTSTDVCLVAGGEPSLTGLIDMDGLPVKTPVIDMVTVGAGGGSVVWVDDGGLLRVGPHSAGAEPGPACYGRGGTAATLTDAHLVRGSLARDALLGGAMHADREAAVAALEPIACGLGLDVEAAADSAIRVAEANIVRAVQRVSTERGLDPRDYVLVPFGGAGPMLAARIAEEIGTPRVLVPPNAGVLSAYGLLASDHVHFETMTRRIAVSPGNLEDIRDTIRLLSGQAVARLEALGLDGSPVLSVVLEMRYLGQAFEIPVVLGEVQAGSLQLTDIEQAFEAAHQRVFEFGGSAHGRCEVVSFRVSAAMPPTSRPVLREDRGAGRPTREIRMLERGEWATCTRYQRGAMPAQIAGPALIEDVTSTVLVPGGWTAAVDPNDNLVLEVRT